MKKSVREIDKILTQYTIISNKELGLIKKSISDLVLAEKKGFTVEKNGGSWFARGHFKGWNSACDYIAKLIREG